MSQQISSSTDANKETETSELYLQAQKIKPEFSTALEALVSIQGELKKLAGSANLTIEVLLKNAEASKIYNEVFLKALSLQSKIIFYKSQIK